MNRIQEKEMKFYRHTYVSINAIDKVKPNVKKKR